MKLLILCVWPILFGLSNATLLEMSQILWSKLLNGSLSAITLDPLRVPVVKIDQSQGNIRYRMILNDVEVVGLNDSTIESVHIGRGSVKSNLSEYEAGYVSYNDAGRLDAVRYRFHTVVKEPKGSEELKVAAIEESEGGADFRRRGTIGERFQQESGMRSEGQFERRREFVRPQEFDERNPEHRRRFQQSQEMNRRYSNQNVQGSSSDFERLESSQNAHYGRFPLVRNQESSANDGVKENHRYGLDESHSEDRRRFQESQRMNQRYSNANAQDSPNDSERSRYSSQNVHESIPVVPSQESSVNGGVRGNQRYGLSESNGESQRRFQQSPEMNQRYRNQNVQGSTSDSKRQYSTQNVYSGRISPVRNQESLANDRVQGTQRYRLGESDAEGQIQFQQSQVTNQRLSNQNARASTDSERSRYAGSNNRGSSLESSGSDGEFAAVNDNQRQRQRYQPNPAVKTQRFNSNDEFSRNRNSEDRNFGGSQRENQRPGNVYVVYDENQERNLRNGGRDCRENQYGCVYGTLPKIQESGVKGSRRNYGNVGAESVNVENRMLYGSRVDSQESSNGNRPRVRYPSGERIVYARIPGNGQAEVAGKLETEEFSERLEDQPGFVDIVYVDKNNNGNRNVKHFGNLRIEKGKDTNVYGLEDIMRDLENHRRFIIHNFTEGESLLKKNNLTRTNEETRRIEDLIRYAKNHQEKEGYFEEGMELIYHYGNNDTTIENKRLKRAHKEEDNDDDIMHVIVRIRVPLLRVKAGYVLMGKVGEQVLHGDGRLDGNFTNLVGDFTVELKKTGDHSMIVRAARARLEATDKNVTLEGMNEKGPVEEILNQGLMAAEAVAAMLADDLATKALSEKTSDSIIYKMYRELPQ